MMRETKATSPPGVTISISAPVQAECGGRDFEAAEATMEVGSVKKGGFVIVKSMLLDWRRIRVWQVGEYEAWKRW